MFPIGNTKREGYCLQRFGFWILYHVSLSLFLHNVLMNILDRVTKVRFDILAFGEWIEDK